jgi:hypothetical protein
MVKTDREELHQRVMLLKEELKNGKIKVAPHLLNGFHESCEKVRLADDGLVIPETVDSRIRNTTLILNHFKERQDLKNQISLREIQRIYFEIIEKNFGELYRSMKKNEKLNPHIIALGISKNFSASDVEKTSSSLDAFYNDLHEFWKATYDITSIHLEDITTLKGVFGGDLFPSYTKNIASTCGLYIDTIVLPDPFIRMFQLYKHWTHEKRVYYSIKHGLNVLEYKMLALAEIETPIVVILPEGHFFEENYESYINKCSEIDILKHAYCLFNINFDNIEDLNKFLAKFKTPHELAQVVRDPSRLLFDIEQTGTSEELIKKQLDFYKNQFNNKINIEHAGQAVIANISGRMRQANDILQKGFKLRSVPIIDAPTSWQYFNWKLEYDAKLFSIDAEQAKQLHLTRAIQQSAETKLQWLGNIPAEVLIKMRSNGFVNEFRQIISNGVEQITDVCESDFNKTTNQVISNIEDAFNEHNNKLKKLQKDELKFYGRDYLSWLALGGISIAAAFFGNSTLALLAAGGGMIGAPNIRELYGKATEIDKESQSIRYSLMGLLFEHSKS